MSPQEIDQMRYDALQRIGLPGVSDFTAHQVHEWDDEMTTIASTPSLYFSSLSDSHEAHYEVDHHMDRSDDTSDEDGDEEVDLRFVLWDDTSDEEGEEEYDCLFAVCARYCRENWNFIVRAAGHLLNVAALAFGVIYLIRR